ncbi:MAG: hypothetical protein IPK25_14130 [Saprospiraceae bacterium]|nr:hypothetical protein [Saprospiraceae bacterium]
MKAIISPTVALLFSIIIGLCLLGCTNKLVAPLYTEMGIDPYGSTIKVKYYTSGKKQSTLKGEILAIQNDSLFILTNRGQSVTFYAIEKISKHDIINYFVFYAKLNSNHGYAVSTALALTHGIFLPMSLIVNAIGIASINVSQDQYYALSRKNLAFEQLYNFSRFPQGIPDGIDLQKIKMR